MIAPGVSVQDMLEFSDLWYELLGEAPENLWSEAQIQRKYMAEIRKCTHQQVRKDYAAFENLHPHDRSKNWEFWPPLLRRLADADLHRSQAQADIKASQPSGPSPKPSAKTPPVAPALLAGDGTETFVASKGAIKREKAAAKKAERAASEKPPSSRKPLQDTKATTEKPPVSALSFMTRSGLAMTEDQKLNSLRQALKTAEAAKEASVSAAPFAHGKGVPPKAPPAHLVAERAAKDAKEAKGKGKQVTTADPKKHGGVDTPTARSESGSERSINSPRSVTSANGTKTEARRPGPGYACKICQSPKHWLAECPHHRARQW